MKPNKRLYAANALIHCSGFRLFWTIVLWLISAATGSAQCPGFGPFQTSGNLPLGLLPAGTLSEVSGVVASRQHPGVLWVHDDSDFGPDLIAIRLDGTLVQQYRLVGVGSEDWEDISIGPGPEPGRDYIYIADIGDNNGNRASVAMYRIPEPGARGPGLARSGGVPRRGPALRLSIPRRGPAQRRHSACSRWTDWQTV